jgi:hypothetical protein
LDIETHGTAVEYQWLYPQNWCGQGGIGNAGTIISFADDITWIAVLKLSLQR